MSLDLAVQEAVRLVVREEIRSALSVFAGGGFSGDAPLSYAQAAKFVGCSRSTVAQWVRRGLLPATGAGKLTRVRRSDLLDVLARLKAPQVEETPAQVAERILTQKPRGAR